MTPTTILAVLALGAPFADGSLVVLQNGNKPVSSYTGSSVTHVAILGTLAGDPWVYEATPALVRRVPLSTYVEDVSELNGRRGKPTRMWIMAPKDPYNHREVAAMRRYFDSQLGRRYSVKGYVRGKEGDGIHCAEFTSSALSATGRFEFSEQHRLSPSDVVARARPLHLPPQPVELGKKTVSPKPWRTRLWHQFTSLRTWCGWACYELWTFCW